MEAAVNELLLASDGLRYHIESYGDIDSPKRLIWCHPLASSIANENRERLWDSWNLPEAARWCTILMEARGHGQTPPQFEEGGSEPAQFSWQAVSESMRSIFASLPKRGQLVLGGASMGSAAALWAACEAEDGCVVGVVICIPPTCYEHRKARSSQLLAAAEQDPQEYYARKQVRHIFRSGEPQQTRLAVPEEGVRSDSFREVMLGSATSDLPPRETIREKLAEIPVLICGWNGDKTHPVSSVEELSGLIPHSQVHVAESLAEVNHWPGIIADFIANLP